MSCHSCSGGFSGITDIISVPLQLITLPLSMIGGALGFAKDAVEVAKSGSDKPVQCGIFEKQTVEFGKWMCRTDYGIVAIGAVALLLLASKIKAR